MPLKRKWFLGRDNVDLLRVDDLTAEEVGVKVKAWCDRQILAAESSCRGSSSYLS